MKNQNFGIEIELTGITRRKAADTIAKYFGGEPAEYIGGTYRAWTIVDTRDDSRKIWKVMSDSSISGERNDTTYDVIGEYQVEIVSPILTYDEIGKLQEIVREIRHAGGIVNNTCGIHVHVDAANHDARTLRNLMSMMYAREDIIYKALEVEPNREYYCKKTDADTLANARREKHLTMDSLRDIWYGDIESEYCTRQHYHKSRYHALNLHATFSKGTVEFRMFNSTLHAGEVKAYVHLALAMSAACIDARTISINKTGETDVRIFAEWLKRIGLAGDEFKNTRAHLLKHLLNQKAAIA